jgi:hypothetical protein
MPKVEHGNAVKWLGRYLKGNSDKGITATLKDEDLVVYVDADFAGNWDPTIFTEDRDTARSRMGYIITYKGIPISWASQLQTEISLSSTESEYIALSQSLRKVIPLMELLMELRRKSIDIRTNTPIIRCTVYEDNEGARAISNLPKVRPRTRHLNTKYHHFRDHVDRGTITVAPIDTTHQPADMLTKPLRPELLRIHRRKVMGW